MLPTQIHIEVFRSSRLSLLAFDNDPACEPGALLWVVWDRHTNMPLDAVSSFDNSLGYRIAASSYRTFFAQI